MTNEQAAARQASHENLMRELVEALTEAEVALNAVRVHSINAPWDSTGPAIIKARAVLARAKEQQQ